MAKYVSISEQIIDITEPEQEIEIIISAYEHDGHVIWVNVDGICRLRVCRVSPEKVRLEDRRGAITYG